MNLAAPIRPLKEIITVPYYYSTSASIKKTTFITSCGGNYPNFAPSTTTLHFNNLNAAGPTENQGS